MNRVPNSDSKLGWVHRMHTQGPSCERTTPRLRAHCAQAASALRLGRAHNVVYQAPPPCPYAHASTGTSCRRLCAAGHVAPFQRRIVAPPPAVSLLSRDTTQWPSRTPLAACLCVPAARPVSRYNALYHDQVQNG